MAAGEELPLIHADTPTSLDLVVEAFMAQ